MALLAEVFDLLGGQAGLQAAADDGDGSGHSAVVTDDLLHLQSGLHVLGVGHTVGDDGGFQSHNGLPGGNGLGNFGFYVQILVDVHRDNDLSELKFSYANAMRLRSAVALMAGLMVCRLSMAMDPAARPARADPRRSVPSR